MAFIYIGRYIEKLRHKEFNEVSVGISATGWTLSAGTASISSELSLLRGFQLVLFPPESPPFRYNPVEFAIYSVLMH